MRILVLHAHPRPSASVAQKALLAAARRVEGVKLHDLYASYPDFVIDAAHEQQLLLRHDLIILQHPFYWYSCPAIIKEWLDIVLDFDWAYGPLGNKLHGKYLMSAITTGGAEEFYSTAGRNRHTIDQFLSPFNQTAHLCGMAWLKPFVVYEGRKADEQQLAGHANYYQQVLEGFANGTVSPLKNQAKGYVLPDSFKKMRKS